MLDKIEFEYVFEISVVVVLSAALFIFREDKNLVSRIITCLVGAVSIAQKICFGT